MAGAPLCPACHADVRTAFCNQCGAPAIAGSGLCAQCAESAARARGQTGASVAGGVAAFALFAVAASMLMGLLTPQWWGGDVQWSVRGAVSLLGGAIGPAAMFGLLWFLGAWRCMTARAARSAVAAGALVGVPLALVLTVLVPLVALGMGAVLVLPVAVGAAEELAKALAALPSSRKGCVRPAQGLFVGLFVGLGFAAAENTLYVWQATGSGDLAAVTTMVGLRLLTAVAHAAWTGCLCYVVWQERKVEFEVTGQVMAMYLIVALLHAVWDYALISASDGLAVLGPVLSGLGTAVTLAICVAGAASRRDAR